MAAQAWSADEWSAIVFHAKNARVKSAARALVPSTKSAARLRELALQTEIRGVPVPCVCTVPGLCPHAAGAKARLDEQRKASLREAFASFGGQSGAGMVLVTRYVVEQQVRDMRNHKVWAMRFRTERLSEAERFAKHVRMEALPVRVRPVTAELGRS